MGYSPWSRLSLSQRHMFTHEVPLCDYREFSIYREITVLRGSALS